MLRKPVLYTRATIKKYSAMAVCTDGFLQKSLILFCGRKRIDVMLIAISKLVNMGKVTRQITIASGSKICLKQNSSPCCNNNYDLP